jgi:FkbM family methyltransferase
MRSLIKKYLKQILGFIEPSITALSSYSQAGEDIIIKFLFDEKKIARISYLDIGTNHPIHCNNTYAFYRKGSRGVCVEADKTLIPLIQNKRKKDKVINAGVNIGTRKEANFYIFNVKAINTFSDEEANKRMESSNFKLIEIAKVPLLNINKLIETYFESFPDLLSLDIEGLDLPVLKTLDFIKYPIPVLCVETCGYSENHIRPKDAAIADFLQTKGYVTFADTYINTIFVHEQWFYTITDN